MSNWVQILNSLNPPMAPVAGTYDGLEYKWKMFVFRPALFKREAIVVSVLGAYLLWFYAVGYLSYSRATKTFDRFKPLLKSNFSSFYKLVHSGPGQHLQYATGRRNIISLHGTLMLYPFHDLFGLIVRLVKMIIEPTFDGSESLSWNLTLGRGETGLQGDGLGVWAVVDKGSIRQIRADRWDLSFPKLHEHASVPKNFQLFSEHSEISEILFKTPNVGLAELLANPAATKVLKFFLITDQPAKRPTKALAAKFKAREIVLSFRKPSSADDYAAVNAWLQVAFNVADLLGKGPTRSDIAKKLSSTRGNVDGDLTKAYNKEQAEDNPEMTAEEKKLAKKKAAREQLSEKELKKLEELEKKREMRKMAKKQGYKGN
ncbi:hypothetical protein BD324DRAFT_638477 [Kockovaella imperatae]|uniref:DUF1682-domain-containing protein n=1 Tax=Kockovaella imperatae TaxID=4999 RepID=A0A1Y1U6U8_9TREE|nr:hypothetical protein BD324DRAFT_638477 [Kockovaella imperatae]ORX33760.1 hypothetical protein BD324DRAFT_638477 [Kockovaella imperatae]